MELRRFNDSKIIDDYQQGKLSDKEKNAFENYLIEKFIAKELNNKEEEFFGELYFRSTNFFEKVKEIEKIILGIKDTVKRGTLDFTKPIGEKFSLLQRFQSFFSTPKLVFITAFLTLAISLPVWQVFKLKSELSDLQRPYPISTESYTLVLIDDALRGEPTDINLTGGEKVFILNFNLSKKVLPGYKYKAQILDDANKIIWEIKNLKSTGRYETFSIACYAVTFNEKRYSLKIIESDERGVLTGEEYLYPFIIIKEKN